MQLAHPQPSPPPIESVLDGAPDPVITTDAEGRVVQFNRAAESTFGYARSQASAAKLPSSWSRTTRARRSARGLPASPPEVRPGSWTLASKCRPCGQTALRFRSS